jgi:hypothetical protein
MAKPAAPTVLVPANQTSVNFPITTTGLVINAPPVTVTITATLGASNVSVALTLTSQRLA